VRCDALGRRVSGEAHSDWVGFQKTAEHHYAHDRLRYLSFHRADERFGEWLSGKPNPLYDFHKGWSC
jgi:hypothetical protein